jgi:hypothetical protein
MDCLFLLLAAPRQARSTFHRIPTVTKKKLTVQI